LPKLNEITKKDVEYIERPRSELIKGDHLNKSH